MINHPDKGKFANNGILSAAKVKQIYSRLFIHHPKLNGTTYGFFEATNNNQRLLYHSGDISGYHSLLAIISEQRWGIFFCYNTDVDKELLLNNPHGLLVKSILISCEKMNIYSFNHQLTEYTN
jgi:hypothetical protein